MGGAESSTRRIDRVEISSEKELIKAFKDELLVLSDENGPNIAGMINTFAFVEGFFVSRGKIVELTSKLSIVLLKYRVRTLSLYLTNRNITFFEDLFIKGKYRAVDAVRMNIAEESVLQRISKPFLTSSPVNLKDGRILLTFSKRSVNIPLSEQVIIALREYMTELKLGENRVVVKLTFAGNYSQSATSQTFEFALRQQECKFNFPGFHKWLVRAFAPLVTQQFKAIGEVSVRRYRCFNEAVINPVEVYLVCSKEYYSVYKKILPRTFEKLRFVISFNVENDWNVVTSVPAEVQKLILLHFRKNGSNFLGAQCELPHLDIRSWANYLGLMHRYNCSISSVFAKQLDEGPIKINRLNDDTKKAQLKKILLLGRFSRAVSVTNENK